MLKRLLAILALLCSGVASAAEAGHPLDRFPTERMNDMAALQNGARLFSNYCLNCHAAAFARYNRMRDIGLTDDQIKKNLLFAGDKVGELMKVSLDPKQAKEWFGGLPPDLSVVARSRASGQGSGADYLYTYLRTFYKDDSKATGWNNLAFPSVGMPHALWELQGVQRAIFEQQVDAHDKSRKVEVFKGFEMVSPGSMDKRAYDSAMADLVAYMQWMGEPSQGTRVRAGVWVLLFVGLFIVIAWRLNAAFWKDIK
ncbi:MAG: cytochrome c1 [Aquabacterium sp.]